MKQELVGGTPHDDPTDSATMNRQKNALKCQPHKRAHFFANALDLVSI